MIGALADVLWDQVGVGAQAIAGALDLDDDGVLQKRIEQGGGDDGIAEDPPHSAKPRFEVRTIAPFS